MRQCLMPRVGGRHQKVHPGTQFSECCIRFWPASDNANFPERSNPCITRHAGFDGLGQVYADPCLKNDDVELAGC